MATATQPSSGKGMRISSGCSTLEEFTAVFRKYCTPNSIFFATQSPRASGDHVDFAVTLKDGKEVMRGSGKVIGSFATKENEYHRPGMVIEFIKLDTMGSILLEELNAGAHVRPLPAKEMSFDVPTLIQESVDVSLPSQEDNPVDEGGPGDEVTRVGPDSDDVANPLGALSSIGLESSVECIIEDDFAPGNTPTAVAADPVAADAAAAAADAAAAAADAADHQDDDDDEDDDDDDNEPTSIGLLVDVQGYSDGMETEETREAPANALRNLVKAPNAPKLPGLPGIAPRADATKQGLGPEMEEPTMVHAPIPTPPPVENPAPVVRAPTPAPMVHAQTPPVRVPAQRAPSEDPSTTSEVEEASTLTKPTLPPNFTVPQPADLASAVMEPMPTPIPGPLPTPGPMDQVPGQMGQAPGPMPGQMMPRPAGQSFPDFIAPAGAVPLPQQLPQPGSMVTKKQAGIVAGLCLVAGVGFGLLIGGGGSSSSSEGAKAASADTDPAAALPLTPDAAVSVPAPKDPAVDDPAVKDPAVKEPVVDTADAAVEVAVVKEPVAAVVVDPALHDPGEPGKGECALTLDILPEDALVTIGTREIALGSKRVNLPCGARPLRITHDKFNNYKGKIILKEGKVTSLEHQLKRAQVLLRIFSNPPKALVSFGGEDVGRTPLKRQVPAYEPIELKLVRSGFRPHTATIEPESGTTLNIKLKKRGRTRKRPRPPL